MKAPVTEEMLPQEFRVVDRRVEAPDVVTIDFQPEEGDGFRFLPGQFSMTYVFGIGEVPLSIGSDPHQPSTLTHTVRRVGAVTAAICELAPGSTIGVRGPYGSAWPLAGADGRDVVMVAGGLGLAALRPAVLEVLAGRERFGSVSLLYGARTPSDLLYREELHRWRARFDIEVEVTVDRSEAGWLGDVGVVTGLLPRVSFEPAETLALVCGPEVMMRVTARELSGLGVPPSSIHLSLERNMRCAIGFCGHCQFGPDFICRDGPVRPYDRVATAMRIGQL